MLPYEEPDFDLIFAEMPREKREEIIAMAIVETLLSLRHAQPPAEGDAP